MKKHEIYTNDFIQAIRRKVTTVLAKYIAVAALFVALCVTFCVLAAFDLLNVYVGCALNVVLTIAFLWFSYLFFTVYYKTARVKTVFVKCLENAYPSTFEGTYAGVEKEDQYLTLHFNDGTSLKLDDNAPNYFVEGKRYCVDVVGSVVISYGEVDYE